MLDKKTVDLKDKIFKAMMTNKRELVRRYGKDAEKNNDWKINFPS